MQERRQQSINNIALKKSGIFGQGKGYREDFIFRRFIFRQMLPEFSGKGKLCLLKK
jgi:hypothetical protein